MNILLEEENMLSIKKSFTFILLFLVTSLLPLTLYGEGRQMHTAVNHNDTSASAEMNVPDYPVMPGPGKKVQLEDGNYLIYKFDKQPKLGTVIIKVEIFNSNDKKDTSMEITGDAGMPSMRGAHDTGDRPFVLSNKGAYLLPVNIVMPGEWKIKLTIKKAGKVIFRGSHRFDV
jgi:hypothetical protein